MFKLRNLLILGAALSFSFTAYGATSSPAAKANNPAATTTLSTKSAKAEVVEKVNINSADEAALTAVKGFGAKKAKAVVDYRTKNGEFKSLDDLLNVKSRGLNKKWLQKMSEHLTI
jgi:competence protein ComEA